MSTCSTPCSQVLDDGRLTDSHGRTVDFRNTVVIMTSNIGSEFLMQGVTADGQVKEDARSLVMGALRNHFRPEFLNRVDEIVLFKPLTLAEIEQIVDLLLNDLRNRGSRSAGSACDHRACAAVHRRARVRPVVRRPTAAALHCPRGRDEGRPSTPAG